MACQSSSIATNFFHISIHTIDKCCQNRNMHVRAHALVARVHTSMPRVLIASRTRACTHLRHRPRLRHFLLAFCWRLFCASAQNIKSTWNGLLHPSSRGRSIAAAALRPAEMPRTKAKRGLFASQLNQPPASLGTTSALDARALVIASTLFQYPKDDSAALRVAVELDLQGVQLALQLCKCNHCATTSDLLHMHSLFQRFRWQFSHFFLPSGRVAAVRFKERLDRHIRLVVHECLLGGAVLLGERRRIA
jgi:hypothetical protein